jgi:tetratricopeptide (TPR) repeat protein
MPVRPPIRFSIAREFVPLHAFPHDARAFGSKPFLDAAHRYYEGAFGPGSVEVQMGSGGLDVTWTPEDAALDPFEYAVELLKKRQLPLAIPILTGLLKERPDDVGVLFNLGMAESDLGKLDEAIVHLTALLEKDPSHAHARIALGVAHGRAGRTDEAIEALLEAVTLAPDDPYARRNLGALLGKKGLTEEAEPHFREAVRHLPDDQQSLYGLGHILLALGGEERAAEAEQLLQKAVELDPDSDIAELCRTERSRIAGTTFRAAAGGRLRMDAVMYCMGAMKTFAAMPSEQVKKVTFEIAFLGAKGLDVNDPEQKYQLRSLPGAFSGLHLVSIMYVGFKLVDPKADAGFDLSAEYEEAKSLAGVVGDRRG